MNYKMLFFYFKVFAYFLLCCDEKNGIQNIKNFIKYVDSQKIFKFLKFITNEKNLKGWMKDSLIQHYDTAFVETKFLNPLLRYEILKIKF